MGRIKQLMIQMEEWRENMPDLTGQALSDAEREFLETEEEFLFDPAKHSSEWVPPRSGDLAVSLRNHARHHAIAAALRSRDSIDEADNMPLWIQLELDLWENMQGLGGECDL